ncbi:MAG: helix-turn-helix transcriptional regulator [Alphaproteobacteria bacterium]|nr:helix-turn-helix transcriptional regulator [Alphaproteobacteria bacterium]
MIISQLNELKNKSNLTLKHIAERSDIPYSTVQKIFNGETQNPNVDYVFRIVTAMGYTMNDLYSTPNTTNKEEASIAIIREMYENRIAELKEQHKEHIADLKEAKTKHGKTYKAVLIIMGVIIGILLILFLIYFAIDFSTDDWGIFFHN